MWIISRWVADGFDVTEWRLNREKDVPECNCLYNIIIPLSCKMFPRCGTIKRGVGKTT